MRSSTPGERLEVELKVASVSQAALAEHLQVSPSTVNHWIKGRRKLTIDDVEEIAAFLGIDPSTIAFKPREPADSPTTVRTTPAKRLRKTG